MDESRNKQKERHINNVLGMHLFYHLPAGEQRSLLSSILQTVKLYIESSEYMIS